MFNFRGTVSNPLWSILSSFYWWELVSSLCKASWVSSGSLSRRKSKDYFSFRGWGSECHSGLLGDTDCSCSILPILCQKCESSVCVCGTIRHQNVSLIPIYLSVIKLQIKWQTLFPPRHCRKTSVLWLHTKTPRAFTEVVWSLLQYFLVTQSWNQSLGILQGENTPTKSRSVTHLYVRRVASPIHFSASMVQASTLAPLPARSILSFSSVSVPPA